MKAALAILLAFSMSACVSESGGDDPDLGNEPGEPDPSATPSPSYSNHIQLECNGSVLVDRTFTVRSECESFRDSNTFYCSGIKLPLSC